MRFSTGAIVSALFFVLGTLLGNPTGVAAQSAGIIDTGAADSSAEAPGERGTPLSSLHTSSRAKVDSDGDGIPDPLDNDVDGDGIRNSEQGHSRNKRPRNSKWKAQAHHLILQHEKAWITPTLLHAATPGVMLLVGLLDQGVRNPDCFDCGSEVSYAASLAIYFHIGSVIAGGTTWLTFADLHNRVRLAESRPRLIDRLRQTSRGLGIGALVSGAIAATSIIAYVATINAEFSGDNPFYQLSPLMLAGYIHSGLAAPVLGHIALANAALADQLQAMDSKDRAGRSANRTRPRPKPRLLALSPFGVAVAF